MIQKHLNPVNVASSYLFFKTKQQFSGRVTGKNVRKPDRFTLPSSLSMALSTNKERRTGTSVPTKAEKPKDLFPEVEADLHSWDIQM